MSNANKEARLSDLRTGAVVKIDGRKEPMIVVSVVGSGATLCDSKGRELEVSDCKTHWIRWPNRSAFRTSASPRMCVVRLVSNGPEAEVAA